MSKVIHIANDFSPFPVGRHRTDGPFTGEAFREDFLIPALKEGSVLVILDDVMGLPTSFFEEAFGGLVRAGFSLAQLQETLTLKAETPRMSLHPARGWGYISDAANAAKLAKSAKSA